METAKPMQKPRKPPPRAPKKKQHPKVEEKPAAVIDEPNVEDLDEDLVLDIDDESGEVKADGIDELISQMDQEMSAEALEAGEAFETLIGVDEEVDLEELKSKRLTANLTNLRGCGRSFSDTTHKIKVAESLFSGKHDNRFSSRSEGDWTEVTAMLGDIEKEQRALYSENVMDSPTWIASIGKELNEEEISIFKSSFGDQDVVVKYTTGDKEKPQDLESRIPKSYSLYEKSQQKVLDKQTIIQSQSTKKQKLVVTIPFLQTSKFMKFTSDTKLSEVRGTILVSYPLLKNADSYFFFFPVEKKFLRNSQRLEEFENINELVLMKKDECRLRVQLPDYECSKLITFNPGMKITEVMDKIQSKCPFVDPVNVILSVTSKSGEITPTEEDTLGDIFDFSDPSAEILVSLPEEMKEERRKMREEILKEDIIEEIKDEVVDIEDAKRKLSEIVKKGYFDGESSKGTRNAALTPTTETESPAENGGDSLFNSLKMKLKDELRKSMKGVQPISYAGDDRGANQGKSQPMKKTIVKKTKRKAPPTPAGSAETPPGSPASKKKPAPKPPTNKRVIKKTVIRKRRSLSLSAESTGAAVAAAAEAVAAASRATASGNTTPKTSPPSSYVKSKQLAVNKVVARRVSSADMIAKTKATPKTPAKASPKLAPKTAPKSVAKGAPKGAPKKASAKGAPKGTKGTPKGTPKASPKVAPTEAATAAAVAAVASKQHVPPKKATSSRSKAPKVPVEKKHQAKRRAPAVPESTASPRGSNANEIPVLQLPETKERPVRRAKSATHLKKEPAKAPQAKEPPRATANSEDLPAKLISHEKKVKRVKSAAHLKKEPAKAPPHAKLKARQVKSATGAKLLAKKKIA